MQQCDVPAYLPALLHPAGDILDVCSDFMGRATDGIMPLQRPRWGMPRRQLLDLLWGNGIEVCSSFLHHATQAGSNIRDPKGPCITL